MWFICYLCGEGWFTWLSLYLGWLQLCLIKFSSPVDSIQVWEHCGQTSETHCRPLPQGYQRCWVWKVWDWRSHSCGWHDQDAQGEVSRKVSGCLGIVDINVNKCWPKISLFLDHLILENPPIVVHAEGKQYNIWITGGFHRARYLWSCPKQGGESWWSSGCGSCHPGWSACWWCNRCAASWCDSSISGHWDTGRSHD